MSDLAMHSDKEAAPSCVRMNISTIKDRLVAVEQLLRDVMIQSIHFGKIQGCGDKPTLLKPGAEMLAMMFRLAPTVELSVTDLGNGHREYTVTCRMKNITSGEVWAEGVGSCSTMESKYRYRTVQDFEITNKAIPKDAKDRKQYYRALGYGMQKVDGAWAWVKYIGSGKVENPDIADTYNTCLKMAKKRAQIDGTLSALGCSHLFTQDIEDLPMGYEDNAPAQTEVNQPKTVEIIPPTVDNPKPKTREQRIDDLINLALDSGLYNSEITEILGTAEWKSAADDAYKTLKEAIIKTQGNQ